MGYGKMQNKINAYFYKKTPPASRFDWMPGAKHTSAEEAD